VVGALKLNRMQKTYCEMVKSGIGIGNIANKSTVLGDKTSMALIFFPLSLLTLYQNKLDRLLAKRFSA
jgi:hypothetical protein